MNQSLNHCVYTNLQTKPKPNDQTSERCLTFRAAESRQAERGIKRRTVCTARTHETQNEITSFFSLQNCLANCRFSFFK